MKHAAKSALSLMLCLIMLLSLLPAQTAWAEEHVGEEIVMPEAPAEVTETEPVTEEPVEEAETVPVAEEPLEEAEAAPAPEEPVEEAETVPVAEEPLEEAEAAPAPEEPVEEAETAPVAEEPVEEAETAPVAEAPIEEAEAESVSEEPVEEAEPFLPLEETAAPTAQTEQAELQAARTVTASGSCGDSISWTLYSDGELLLSGSGSMDCAGWEDYTDSVYTVTVGEGITALSMGAFSNHHHLSQVTLPSTLQSIAVFAFYGDESLESITIPEAVTVIDELAFCQSGLCAVTIPQNVWSISSSAFCNCQQMGSFSVASGNRYFSAPDGVLMDAGQKRLIAYPCARMAKRYSLPDTVEVIGESAFLLCGNLEEVTLPDGLTELENSAFDGCEKLEAVTIPSQVVRLGKEAFLDCTALREIRFTGSMPEIGENAFGSVNATVYYPAGNSGWSAEKRLGYGGTLQYVALNEDGSVASVGWEKVGSSWYYRESDGSYVVGWKQISGKWYFFNAAGVMQTGWQKISGKWFYFNAGGDMALGRKQIGGKWYYFDAGGAMQTGWQKIGGKWYFFDAGGVMQTGWQKISGKWFYFNAGGDMALGWKQLGGKWYYFDAGGAMRTGWVQVSGKWYYLNASGVMHTGWLKLSDKWYYLNASGVMQVGWGRISGSWYYFSDSGVMQTGWVQVSGKWYYLNASGVMQTGWLKLSDKWYYLNASGVMQVGWAKISGSWYYFNASGVMHTGWLQLDGAWYYLKSNGVMAASETVNGYSFDASGRWIQGVAPDAELNRANILALLDGYDSDGAYLIRHSSEDSLMSWFNNAQTIGEGIDQMGTAVHEQCHDFCGTPGGMRYNATQQTYTAASEYIYTGGGKYTNVTFTDVYDSYEMASTIPASLQTFRYDTYVAGDYYMASRQYGIYGLFNEFTAYCWGFHCNVMLEAYQKENGLFNPYQTSNDYVSYAEFRYYILRYMIYAKEHYPDVYSQILANDSFRSSFTSVESTFGRLVSDWRASRSSLPTSFENEYNALMAEMEKAEYKQMMNLLRP